MARVFAVLLVVQLLGWSQAARYAREASVPPIGRTAIVYDTDVSPPALYWEVNATMLEQLQAQWPAASRYATFLFRIEVPEKAKEMTIYDFLMVSFNPSGHPGWDARQFDTPSKPGGYGDSHFDIHFYIDKTIAWAQQELGTDGTRCTGPAPGVCWQASLAPPATTMNAKNVQYETLPAADYITNYGVERDFGGAAVEEHGNHLLPLAQMYKDTYHCTSTGPEGTYVDCIMQAAALQPPSWGNFVDMNCTCGEWNMPHPLLITYDGEVVAHEIMPSIKHYMMMKNGPAQNPWIQDFPQPNAFAHDTTVWKRVEKLYSHYDATAGVMRWGLQMHAGAPPDEESSKAAPASTALLGSILAIAAATLFSTRD